MSCRYKLTAPGAKPPTRGNSSAVGFDLHLIRLLEIKGDVEIYDTGVAVEPPEGMYFLLYPRSSLTKTDYWLANGVGVIDPDYRGSIQVALRRRYGYNPGQLELPGRYVQLVPQNFLSDLVTMEQVSDLSVTERNDKGFGSTGIK